MKNKWKLHINCSESFWKIKKEYGYTQFDFYPFPAISINYYHDPNQDDQFKESPVFSIEWLFWCVSIWAGELPTT